MLQKELHFTLFFYNNSDYREYNKNVKNNV